MMQTFDVWPQLWPSLILCGAPLALAWLADKAFRSRAAVRSLRLRAALLATIALAILPLLPLQLPRPSWLPAPLVAHSVEVSAPSAAPQPLPAETESAPPLLPSETSAAATQIEAPPQLEASTPRKYLQRDSSVNWPQIATGIWLLGALILLSWSAFCHAHIARLRGRSQVLAEGKLFDAATEIARDWQMTAPRLLQTPTINSPFAIGVWRRAICWPANFHADNNESWRAILRHEMAHCRRHDCAWNAFAQIVRALLWPHPLLWWACRAIRRNAEDVCDEAAIETCAPPIYARGLLDLSQNVAASTCSATRTASAGALPSQPELSRRVAAILRPGARDAWRVGWRTRIATVAALSLVIGLGAMLTSAPAQESETAASRSGEVEAPVKIDLSTPQATLDTFVAAVKAGDARALAASVETKNSVEDLKSFALHSPLYQNSLSVSPWQIELKQNSALGRARISIEFPRGVVQHFDTILNLKKFGNNWQIASEQSQLKKAENVLAVLAKTAANPEIKRMNLWARTHENAVLTGKVVLADGSPAAAAHVELRILDEERRKILGSDLTEYLLNALPKSLRRLNTNTDARGNYRFEGLTGATYLISAYSPLATRETTNPYLATSNVDARQIALEQQVVAHADKTTPAPVLKTQVTGQIDVLTLDARDGQPLEGLVYSATKGSGKSLTLAGRQSRGDGHAMLSILPGKIMLSLGSNVSEKGVRSASISQGKYLTNTRATVQLEDRPPIPFAGTTSFTVVAGQTRRVTVRLMPLTATKNVSKAKISPSLDTAKPASKSFQKTQPTVKIDVLTVDLHDGQPLQGASYSASTGSATNRVVVARTSGVDGHAILNVPPGEIRLDLGMTNYGRGDKAFSTARGSYEVHGHSRIQIEDRPSIPYHKGGTSFTVPAGQTRRVTVRLMPLPGTPRIQMTQAAKAAEIKRLENWAVNHGRATLTGQVLAADGSPAAGATVRVKMGDDSYRQIFSKGDADGFRVKVPATWPMLSRSVTTDKAGRYRITGLTKALYSVSTFWPATPRDPKIVFYDSDYNARQIALGQKVRTSEGATTTAPIIKTRPTTRVDVLTVDARTGRPLQGVQYVVRIGQDRTKTTIGRASGADGHTVINVPIGHIWLALVSNTTENGISLTTTSRGKYVSFHKGTVEYEDRAPIPYKGGNALVTKADKTYRATVRLMPLATP